MVTVISSATKHPGSTLLGTLVQSNRTVQPLSHISDAYNLISLLTRSEVLIKLCFSTKVTVGDVLDCPIFKGASNVLSPYVNGEDKKSSTTPPLAMTSVINVLPNLHISDNVTKNITSSVKVAVMAGLLYWTVLDCPPINH